MSTVLRPPLITRLWSRDPAGVAIRAQSDVWQNQLTTNLRGQDLLPTRGLTYDYPNPRAPAQASDLRTWVWPLNLNLRGQDRFFGAGGPTYDYPNPRAPARSSELRTWLHPTPFYFIPQPFFGVAGHPNYDWPNPSRGPVYANFLRGWIDQGFLPQGRVIGTPTLCFTSDMEAVECTASDSPSGQNWSGSGYMARYEIDTSIQIEGVFLDALNNVYIDPTEVQLFIKDPSGTFFDYTTLDNTVIKESVGHYIFTFVPDISGTWTYKWQGTGIAPATSPDTTFTVNASILVLG